MSEEKWFWEKDGERLGPDSATTLIAKLEAGELTRETLVWREGMSDWKALSGTELAPSGPTPPGLPPRSETTPPPPPPPPEDSIVLSPVAAPPEAPVRNAALRAGFRPQIRHSFSRAWNLMKADFWPYVGFFTLMIVLYSIASQLIIPVFFLMIPLMVGFSWYVLNRIRNRPASIDDLFFGFKRGFGDLALLNLVLYTPVFVVSIIAVMVMAFGIMFATESGSGAEEVFAAGAVIGMVLVGILLTIAGLLIYALSNFASLLILDCGMKWKEALGLAWQACKAHLGKIMLFYIAVSIVSSLGMIAIYIGILVTGALAMIAMTYLYEDAFGESGSEESA